MAHKSSRYLFDDELAALIAHFQESGADGDELSLVLNGDIIDFDLVVALPSAPPWPVSRSERKHGLLPTGPKSAWKLGVVLAAHPRFVAALARFLAAGHRVVYVMGNHDRELHFGEVQEAFVAAVRAQGERDGLDTKRGAILFEPWFYYVPGELYCEHGNQYDHYTTFRYLLAPVVQRDGERQIALTTGNFSSRFMMNRMGYFNPHHHGEYILSFFRYLAHWARHYALSRRGLILPWLWGSLRVVAASLRVRAQLATPPAEHVAALDALAARHHVSRDELGALGGLQSAPIGQRLYRLLRGMWIDRAMIAGAMLLGALLLVLSGLPLWVKLMVPLSTFPLLFLIYERVARDENGFTVALEMPERARRIAEVLPARVYAFSHTHAPREIPLAKDITYVDTGSWAPITLPEDKTRLRGGLRSYLEATFTPQEARVELRSWMLPA